MYDLDYTERIFEVKASELNIAFESPLNMLRLFSRIYRQILFSYGKCFELNTIERNRMICLDTDVRNSLKIISAAIVQPIEACITDSFLVHMSDPTVEVQFITLKFKDETSNKITLFNLNIESLMLVHFETLTSLLDILFKEIIQAIITRVNPQGTSLRIAQTSITRFSNHLKWLHELVYENLHLFTKAAEKKEILSIVIKVKIFPEEPNLHCDP